MCRIDLTGTATLNGGNRPFERIGETMTAGRTTVAVRVLTVAAVLGFLSGCTDPATGPKPTGSATSIAPGVTPPPEKTETPSPVTADAVVSYVGVDVDGVNVSAAGYIQGVLENGGACTFTFTGTAEPVAVSSEGIADSSTTSCGTVQVPLAQLPSGTWSVVLSYSSDSIDTLVSTALTVEVP